MAKPEVHGQPPDGVNAGAALDDDSNVEDATVKEIRDAGGSGARENPSGGDSPAWMGVVEDLLRVGGKELFSAAKDYVRKGNLNLFTRRNPSDAPSEGSGQSNAPQVPPPDHFKDDTDDPDRNADGASQGRKTRGNKRAKKNGSAEDGPSPNPAAHDVTTLSPGDLARVEVGNSVVWVKVTGTADGTDDYEGRLATSALGLAENSPVTFAKRHLLGRVGEAPKDPTPGPPEGIAGKRTRDNPASNGGPLPPRF